MQIPERNQGAHRNYSLFKSANKDLGQIARQE
jgi:hypothetical protein